MDRMNLLEQLKEMQNNPEFRQKIINSKNNNFFNNFNSKIQVKKLTATAHLPTKGSDGAAGWDLYADVPQTIFIAPGEVVKIPTGIAMALPAKTFGAIYARSGLATNKGLAPANKVGIIDNDYRGEIIVALRNESNEVQSINPNDRIAQMIIQTYIINNLEEVSELTTTNRGTGGFGSTGIK